MHRSVSTFMLTIAVSCLLCADAVAQRSGRGTSSIRGGSSIRSGSSYRGRSSLGSSIGSSRVSGLRSSIGGNRPSSSIGGSVSGRSRYQTSSPRRVPNSASSIRSLQPSYRSNYGSSSASRSRSFSSSRNRIGGSSLGIFIGGSSLSRYGSLSPYGNFGYNVYQPYGYNGGYSIRQPTYGSLNVIVPPTGSIGVPVLPAQPVRQPVIQQQPVLNQQAGVPRNSLPLRSIVTNGAPNIGQPGKAVLFNPPESGGSVNYVLNGRPYTIRPGEAQPIDLDQTWTLELDRGLNNEIGRYTLTEGIHKFGVGRRGWEVVPTQPTTTTSNKIPSNSPAPPVPVQALPQPNSGTSETLDNVDPLPPIPDNEVPTLEAPTLELPCADSSDSF